MSFHLKDDFNGGAPISKVPASWFNSVAKFLNGLVGGDNVSFEKHDDGSPTVVDVRPILNADQVLNDFIYKKETTGPGGTSYAICFHPLKFDRYGRFVSVDTGTEVVVLDNILVDS